MKERTEAPTLVFWVSCCPETEVCRVGVVVDRAADQVLTVGSRKGMLCLMQQLQQWHTRAPMVGAWPLLFICSPYTISMGVKAGGSSQQ